MLLQTVILNVLVCIIWISSNVQTKLHNFSILVTQYKQVHVFTFTKDLDKPIHDLRLYHYKFWEFLRTGFWNLWHFSAGISQVWWPSWNLPSHDGKKGWISISVNCPSIRDLHVKSSSLMMYELRVWILS